MRNIINLLLFIAIIFSASCRNEHDLSLPELLGDNNSGSAADSLAPAEYIRWIEDPAHGIKVQKTIGDFTFMTFYKPYEYLVARELKAEAIKKEVLDREVAEIKDLQYFTFKISSGQNDELLRVGITNENEYASRIEYCSFLMQNDLKLLDGGDTLDCTLFHFERVYNLAPEATFVLGFPAGASGSSSSDKTLMFEDKLFGVGKVNLTISGKNINSLPRLITN